jgi:hypothetical protein
MKQKQEFRYFSISENKSESEPKMALQSIKMQNV